MKKSTERLMAKLKAKCLSPNTTRLHVNGRYTATWYVDDDDDRRIEMTDSLYTDKVVLTAHDGLPPLRDPQGNQPVPSWWPATVVVLSDADQIIAWLAEKQADLASRPSPRGRPR